MAIWIWPLEIHYTNRNMLSIILLVINSFCNILALWHSCLQVLHTRWLMLNTNVVSVTTLSPCLFVLSVSYPYCVNPYQVTIESGCVSRSSTSTARVLHNVYCRWSVYPSSDYLSTSANSIDPFMDCSFVVGESSGIHVQLPTSPKCPSVHMHKGCTT